MSLFLLKSILATVFLIAGIVAILCMLTLMGKAERKMNASFLRKMHRGAGILFTLLLIVISIICIIYVARMGDALSTRAVFHSVLSLFLIVVLFLKISFVRFFKQFLRFVPQMGMMVFILTFVVFSTSAGYYFLISGNSAEEKNRNAAQIQAVNEGSVENGAALFANKCSGCHLADSEKNRSGPGLKNILKNEKLPHSGKPATVENILLQLNRPVLAMPAFPSFSEQELADLIAYMKTL
jgi:cytochrome c1